MANRKLLQDRLRSCGLSDDPKYHFLLGPLGLLITLAEKVELEAIGRRAAELVKTVDSWYAREREQPSGSRWPGLLHRGLANEYINFPWRPAIPITFMVDTVWTTEGWRVVEVDVTNRNAMGYPLLMRGLYDLSSLWRGLPEEWRSKGWNGTTQIMASHHRYYDPYFRHFLQSLNGELITEEELPAWLERGMTAETKLLDLPILYRSKPVLPKLLEVARDLPIAIPPKHYLSSKAVLALPWETDELRDHPITAYLPETRLIRKHGLLPTGNFFVKLLQSGGAHGTFYNDHASLTRFAKERRPQAVWQQALPIATRPAAYLNDDGTLVEGNFYVRISLFVNCEGEVVDADATCSPNVIVHGSKESIMTVPVLS